MPRMEGKGKPTHRFFGSASRFPPRCDCGFLRGKRYFDQAGLSPRPRDVPLSLGCCRGAGGVPLPPTHDAKFVTPVASPRPPRRSQPRDSTWAQDVSRLVYKQVCHGCPHADTRGPWLPPPSARTSAKTQIVCNWAQTGVTVPARLAQSLSPATYPDFRGGLVLTALRPSAGSLGGRGLAGLLLEGEQSGGCRWGSRGGRGQLRVQLGAPFSQADPAGQMLLHVVLGALVALELGCQAQCPSARGSVARAAAGCTAGLGRTVPSRCLARNQETTFSAGKLCAQTPPARAGGRGQL